ncbi:MAG: NUDIX domain-containing protein, partial [Christensenellales bacterium]
CTLRFGTSARQGKRSMYSPGTPNCDVCPLRAHCDAYDAGDAEDLPVLPQKNPPKPFDWDVLLIFSGEKVLMRQRTETMLHGLWVFPMLPGHSEHPAELGAQLHLAVRNVRPAGEAKHVFTHQIWRMKLYQMDAPDADAPKGYRFVALDEMDALTIPTAMKAAGKVARARLEENSEFGMRNAE